MMTRHGALSSARLLNAVVLAALALCALPAEDVQASEASISVEFSKNKRHPKRPRKNKLTVTLTAGECRTWVPGYHEERTEWVLVEEERTDYIWVEPVYTTIGRGSVRVHIKVSDGYWEEVHVPARYEEQTVRVWVPGYWQHHSR